jgi:murein DD-endopeptidase MepM/ murein hydrolase activator NlpD
MAKQKIRFLGDTLGLAPFPLRIKQALVTIRGEEDVPPSRWGLSSLKQLYPKVALKLWRGTHFIPNKVIISNLFNHTPTPHENGWSVRKTQTLDFRGRGLTYDSHNGTDFAIPVGTTVCTAAAGKVVHVVSEFNRGGLKIFIDHGEGLMTCYAHLAKSLVHRRRYIAQGASHCCFRV